MAADPIVYCLTRDLELAEAIDARLHGAIAFFFNDAGRLEQAVTLRGPDHVLVDTGAVRAEYGDAGLGPIFEAVRRRAASARLSVKPAPGVEHLVAAEAGTDVTVVPADIAACVDAVALACGCD
jgi:hypothetical protein